MSKGTDPLSPMERMVESMLERVDKERRGVRGRSSIKRWVAETIWFVGAGEEVEDRGRSC